MEVGDPSSFVGQSKNIDPFDRFEVF